MFSFLKNKKNSRCHSDVAVAGTAAFAPVNVFFSCKTKEPNKSTQRIAFKQFNSFFFPAAYSKWSSRAHLSIKCFIVLLSFRLGVSCALPF